MKSTIKVISNGNQAPYGIGETIEIYCNTNAGLKKALKLASKWYNQPSIIIDGDEYEGMRHYD